jgi:hypothetical protein
LVVGTAVKIRVPKSQKGCIQKYGWKDFRIPVESLKNGFNEICSSVSLFVSICAKLCIAFGEEWEYTGFCWESRKERGH